MLCRISAPSAAVSDSAWHEAYGRLHRGLLLQVLPESTVRVLTATGILKFALALQLSSAFWGRASSWEVSTCINILTDMHPVVHAIHAVQHLAPGTSPSSTVFATSCCRCPRVQGTDASRSTDSQETARAGIPIEQAVSTSAQPVQLATYLQCRQGVNKGSACSVHAWNSRAQSR